MSWTTSRRETGLVEHVCEHGIGHPNRGSALWCAEAMAAKADVVAGDDGDVDDLYGAWMVHGCDGCCGHDDFPGTEMDALKHSHKLIRANKKAVLAIMAAIVHHEQTPWWRRRSARCLADDVNDAIIEAFRGVGR